MEALAFAAVLTLTAIATTAIVLLRNTNLEKQRLLEEARRSVPDAPVVEVRSPAFVATVSGRRYHLGCVVDDHDHRYAVWTTRSHRVVQFFPASETGWRQAWELHNRIEHDRSPAWIDHRGAPRSRLEWKSETPMRSSV